MQPLVLFLGYRGAAVSGTVGEPTPITRERYSPADHPVSRNIRPTFSTIGHLLYTADEQPS